ncbi:response regulator [Peristeroidobacter soli]|jgi:CheY-like chemotaxis protein/signal transduction histidine kinase|uniref:response regulator n=1 Tax=Peristeroidobacter soli TaxID=2497877 RepID=UPI00101BC5E7|nr:response regulator [Peristeroidobacter soli]
MRKRFEKETHDGWYVFIAASMLAIFAVDLQTRIGIATWLFYLIPLGACIFLTRPGAPLLVAALSTVLIVVDYIYSPTGGTEWVAQLNRSFATVVIWAFAIQTRMQIVTRQSLRKDEWMRNAESTLSQRMLGELTLTDVGERITAFVSEYLGASVGALYARQDATGAVLIGGYAIPAAHPARVSIVANEGLIGQVLKGRKAIHLKDVPAGELEISGALGTIRPKTLVVSPVIADGVAVGALELGFLEAIGRADLELLELLGESMGIAIRTARLRNEREELLRATQQQAEELQTQQEELRVSNEELEQQGNMLRDSQARLEDQQAELEQSNVQLEEHMQMLAHQNDDLDAARRELLGKAAELERSNQFKSEFLANMSHELRTPLNSSLILAKLLADNTSGNLTEEQVKFARNIYSAGNDLLELINDILDLSKIEARQIDLKRERVGLQALVDNMGQMFRPMAGQKRVELELTLANDAPAELETDSQRLRQVLRNLLSNALKFTMQGKVSLKIFTRAGTGDIAFTVEDTGIGIPPDKQEIIFEPFRQADGTTNRRFGGTGLGLSISRELAAMLGGHIELHSELGVGSAFTLVLPRTMPAQEGKADLDTPRPPPASVPVRTRESRLVERTNESAPTVSNGARLLLIVEDDETFAHTIATLASGLQFECMIAHTADEGIELALKHRPTAIVLDIRLPDHTGLTVLDRLKHDPATRHIPVQVISGHDYTHVALEMGAANVLRKPVEREELLGSLTKLASKANDATRAVLIVEDNAMQRDSIEHLLRSEQVQTVAVASAADALEKLRSSTFDCMVLDLALPDASGYELLEKMATDEAYSFPPVIVYTGRTLSADEEQQLRRYSKSIIIKGTRSPERLLDEVTLFLHRVEASLPAEQQRMLRVARSRDSVFEKRHILLVEDDVRNVFAITRVLEPHGAIIEIARNGREALEVLGRNAEIDLVLMDIMMPEMDGFEATRAIRAERRWANLPIIALTAKAMPDDRQKCLQAGANDYITKPIDIEKLLSLLRIWMPMRRGAPR